MEKVRRFVFSLIVLWGLVLPGSAPADSRPVAGHGSGGGFGLFFDNDLEGSLSDAARTIRLIDAGAMNFVFQPMEYAVPFSNASMGVIGGLKWIGDAFRSNGESFKAAGSVDPVPMVGLNVNITLLTDLVSARVLAAGMPGNGNQTAFAGHADISFTPHPDLYISGGYHVFSFDMTSDGMELKLDEVVPYVSLTLNF